jgi:ketosteroid isomerase-like protein
MRQLICFLYSALILTSCMEQSIDQEAEAQKLMELSRAWAKATQSRDVEACVSFWAEDAILMSPDEGVRVGKDNLRGMVERSMQIPGFEINWEPQEAFVSKSGDLGYVIIKNYMTMPIDTLGNTQTVFHKGVEIWKKQPDGQWKNAVDISNSDPTIKSIY